MRISFIILLLALFAISCNKEKKDTDDSDENFADNDLSDETVDIDDISQDDLEQSEADEDSFSDNEADEIDSDDDSTVVMPEKIYVKSDASGNNDGTSWENAYTDLQDAIDAANGFKDIWVAKGIYKPSRIVQSMTPIPDPEDPDYERYRHFSLKNNITVLGGFAGHETSSGKRNWISNKTILSGDLDGSGDLSDRDAYHVFLNVNIDETAILDGFVISGGNANSSAQFQTDVHMWHGGGMNNRNLASPTIRNCTFEGNIALINGGGMANLNSSPKISGSVFKDNSAARGGGISNYTSSPAIIDTLFRNNSAVEGYGGAIINADKSRGYFSRCTFEDNIAQDAGAIANNVNSNVTIDDCVFSENSAGKNGGAITNAQSSPLIKNSIFEGNFATVAGGAIENYNDSSPDIVNSTFKNNSVTGFGDGGAVLTSSGQPLIVSSVFYGNSAYNGGAVANRDTAILIINSTFFDNSATGEFGYGGAIYNESNATPEIVNSILWDNSTFYEGPEIYNQFATPRISFSNIEGAFPEGIWDADMGSNYGNNISAMPSFSGSSLGDFSLQPASPCIDKGTNKPFEAGGIGFNFQNDMNENNRIINEIIDIGAYEFVQ